MSQVVYKDRYLVYTLSFEDTSNGEWIMEESSNDRVKAIQLAERIKKERGPQIIIRDAETNTTWDY